MTESFELDELLNRYAAGSCTQVEFDRLMALIAGMEAAGITGEHWKRSWEALPLATELSPAWRKKLQSVTRDAAVAETKEETPQSAPVIRPRKWFAAAAVIFLLAAGCLFRFLATHSDKPVQATVPADRNSYHGHDRAVLTLADGRRIGLDTAALGRVAIASGVKISKAEEGELFYYPEPSTGTPGYNTIDVPRSGNYVVVLTDGSRVHLNAGSSLRFPVTFTGQSRDVTLSGEGYFEVVKNPSRPFHVKTNGFTVEVFGTHFNVKAYNEDGHSSATLVEGKVRIRPEGSKRPGALFLKPSQQADLNASGKLVLNASPNLDEVLAWQTNNFKYIKRPVSSILRDVARWYDVQVVYRGAPPGQQLTGTFSRNTDLPQLVAMLRYAGVKIKIAPDQSLVVGE